jgi:hypothetical protein
MTVEKMEPGGYISCCWLIDGRVAHGMFRSEMVTRCAPASASSDYTRQTLCISGVSKAAGNTPSAARR